MTREKLAPVMLILWLVPLVLAATLWFWPPRGDDSYHHTINAIEQAFGTYVEQQMDMTIEEGTTAYNIIGTTIIS